MNDETISKAEEWHERILKLSTESENRDFILEHAKVLGRLIEIAKEIEFEESE